MGVFEFIQWALGGGFWRFAGALVFSMLVVALISEVVTNLFNAIRNVCLAVLANAKQKDTPRNDS